MRTLARFLAVILALVFVVATVVVVFLHPVGTRCFQSGIYKSALVREHIYEKFPALAGESVALALAEKEGEGAATGTEPTDESARFANAAIRQLSAEDWETLLGAVVPADVLQREVEGSLDRFAGFVHGEDTGANAKLSLVEVKRRLTGAEAADAYGRMLATKPPCTSEQFEASAGLPIACRPPPERMAEVLDNFGKIIRTVAEQIPNEVDPLSRLRELDGPEGTAGAVQAVRTRVRRWEWMAGWSPAVPVALALLMALLAVRSARGLFLWWGIPCLIAGIGSAVIALPFALMAPAMVHALALAQLPPEVPAVTVQAVMGVMAGIVHELTKPALTYAAALALGGVVAIVLAGFFKPRHPVAVPPPVPGQV